MEGMRALAFFRLFKRKLFHVKRGLIVKRDSWLADKAM